MGEQMAKAIPNTELFILDGAGHHSYLDDREQFERRVLSFLSGETT
jgi:pimeloyl-ACP methyl ester carboxylesterase